MSGLKLKVVVAPPAPLFSTNVSDPVNEPSTLNFKRPAPAESYVTLLGFETTAVQPFPPDC